LLSQIGKKSVILEFVKNAKVMSCILIIGFISATLCLSSNAETQIKYFNVMDYGAHGDGTSDDSNVYGFLLSYSLSHFIYICCFLRS